jgi:hypothetical protein
MQNIERNERISCTDHIENCIKLSETGETIAKLATLLKLDAPTADISQKLLLKNTLLIVDSALNCLLEIDKPRREID